jgi:hypothetical protein
MKVSYTGIKSGLPAKLQDKLDTKFAKLSKLVDGRGEKQAHVVVTRAASPKRRSRCAFTITNWWESIDSDVFVATGAALVRIGAGGQQGAMARDHSPVGFDVAAQRPAGCAEPLRAATAGESRCG